MQEENVEYRGKEILEFILRVGIFCIVGYLLIIGGELIIRGDFKEVYDWIMTEQKQVFLNTAYLTIIIGVLTLIFNKWGYAVLISGGTYYLACIISYYKYTFRQEYMYPIDVTLVKEAVNIMGNFEIKITPHIIWAIFLFIWLILIVFKVELPNIKVVVRVIGVVGLGIVITFMTKDVIMNKEVLSRLGIEITWDVPSNYEKNGYLLSFVNHARGLIVNKPDNYNQDTIELLLNKNINAQSEFNKPNIIMIMSEAFYDITKIEDLSLSEDPLKNFHRYQQEYIGGDIITSIAIGGTAQTEYEVLTGNSVNFIGEDNIAYTNYVKQETPSISSILKKEGYRTIGIHPYLRDFYARDTVYPLLGIDEYITEENFEDAEIKRGYITDMEVSKKIITEYEKTEGEPFLAHVVTMQNHAPFDMYLDDNGVLIQNEDMQPENKEILTTYVNGLKDSDEALKYLVEYFSHVDEPTVIMFYGDHIPLLGENQSVFEELEYLQGDIVQETFKKYQTPFMIWNNYGLESKQYGFIDSSYLGAVLLDTINYNKDPYFMLLINTMDKIRAYSHSIYIDSEGELKHVSLMKEEEKYALEKMWTIMYDRIYGKKYSME